MAAIKLFWFWLYRKSFCLLLLKLKILKIFIAFEFLQRGTKLWIRNRYFNLKIFKLHRIFLFNDAKSLNYSKTDFSCSLDQQTASQIGISTLFLFPKRVHFTLQLSLNLHLRRKNFIFCDVAMLFSMTFVCILQNFKSKEYIIEDFSNQP